MGKDKQLKRAPDAAAAAPPAKKPRADSASDAGKWIVGVACMDVKARSKPMRNILNRMISNHNLQVVVFGDKVILDEDIHHWPTCHFLISFFSTGFPLEKAIDYVRLRRPFCINNLEMQKVLMDRRMVLSILDHVGVPTPKRLISNSSATDADITLTPEIIQHVRSTVGVNVDPNAFRRERVIQVDADTIKLGDVTLTKPFVEKPVSGEDHNIFIYYHSSEGGGVRKLFRKVGNKSSEFCADVSDIRSEGSYIYEEFMSVDNAEDVKVYTIGENFAHAETRKSPVVDGVVRRNSEGKEVRYVTELSPEEKGYSRKVCKAFEQTVCGFDLLRAGGKSYVIDVNGWSFVKGNLDYYDKCTSILNDVFTKVSMCPSVDSPVATSVESQWQLKAFLSVLRHGDRTPKQKAKFNFKSKPFMDLLNGLEEEVVLKSEEQLKIVSTACDLAIAEKSEDPSALTSLRTILNFKSSLPGTKVQVKPSYNKVDKTLLEKAQLIVKWGGEFTHGGKHQSKDLGENLRKDLQIINPAVLNDIKIYSSSERRVIATAEVCAKALLDTETLPSDLIRVNKEMLDDSNAAKEQIETIKSRLQAILNPHAPTKLPEHYVPEEIQDPEIYLHEMIELMRTVRMVMRSNLAAGGDFENRKDKWCCFESPYLFQERWEKLFKEFCDVERTAFEPSKISELYDSIKYDLLHNREFLDIVFSSEEHGLGLLRELYRKAKTLFDFIGPQEYGIEPKEKLEIGMLSSQALLKQLVSDMKEAKNSPHPSTRMYFTKESKVICLFNIVLLCGLPTLVGVSDMDELDYLTQINFELHERKRGVESEDREYSLRIAFSPGAHDPNLMDMHFDAKHSLSVAPRKWISDHISLDEALSHLSPP
ncbi:histidine phosphatase superfamily-domain-containing protein [Obelidium mucronatum]|nr:histidine phosphatase superfamily-domain-containing protein [Obelidium mucronatum]